jgi:hypothetical protein
MKDLDEEELPSLVLEVLDLLLKSPGSAAKKHSGGKGPQAAMFAFIKECLMSSSWRVLLA